MHDSLHTEVVNIANRILAMIYTPPYEGHEKTKFYIDSIRMTLLPIIHNRLTRFYPQIKKQRDDLRLLLDYINDLARSRDPLHISLVDLCIKARNLTPFPHKYSRKLSYEAYVSELNFLIEVITYYSGDFKETKKRRDDLCKMINYVMHS